MADNDNFDIDLYGDGEGMDEDSKAYIKVESEKKAKEEPMQPTPLKSSSKPKPESVMSPSTPAVTTTTTTQRESQIHSASTDPKSTTRPNPQQGTKRKNESIDDRSIDANATNALLLSDLHWWTTEDDIRSWAADANAEDELRDITFSEHKVNGKSKGQAYVEFATLQASTALKHKVEKLINASAGNGAGGGMRKFSVVFTSAATNSFKTLPKDAPARGKEERGQRSGSAPYSGPPGGQHDASFRGGFRGRGGYAGGRGNYQNQNGYNQNRNFSGPMNGGGNNSFNNQGGFQPNMGMMNGNSFNGGFGGRGGMNNGMRGGGGMRGGRGGAATAMNPAAAMMNPMGMNMAMMGMNPMVAGMGPQGFGNAQFNPAMFGQGGMNMMSGGGDWGHGPKRQRQD